MAASTTTVHLKDGPCDGEDVKLTEKQIKAASYTCGGAKYTPYLALFTPGGEPIWTAASGQVQPPTSPTSAMGEWSAWMHTLAHNGPASVRAVNAAAARVRRVGR